MVSSSQNSTDQSLLHYLSWAIFRALNIMQDGWFGETLVSSIWSPNEDRVSRRNKGIHPYFSTPPVTFRPLIVLQRDHTGVTLVNYIWSLIDNHVNRRTIRTKEFISTFRRLSCPLIVLQRDHYGVTAVLCSRFFIDNHDSHRQWTKEFSYIVISALLSAFRPPDVLRHYQFCNVFVLITFYSWFGFKHLYDV